MATAERLVYPHITRDPAVCSGAPCVEGTRIRVVDVVSLHEDGLSPGEIVRQFPSLKNAAEVYAALLYYHDHRDEIEADLREEERLEQEVGRGRSKA